MTAVVFVFVVLLVVVTVNVIDMKKGYPPRQMMTPDEIDKEFTEIVRPYLIDPS